MAKPRKPNTIRKPPVPSDSHADIEDWMRRVIGMDIHRTFAEVVFWEDGRLRCPKCGWQPEKILETMVHEAEQLMNRFRFSGMPITTSAASPSPVTARSPRGRAGLGPGPSCAHPAAGSRRR